MFSVSVKIRGIGAFGVPEIELRRFSKRIQNQIENEAFPDIRQAVLEGAIETRNDIILSMRNSPATGKRYSRGGGKVHIASSPGNPPRVDTGNLIGSIIMDDRVDEFEVGSIISDPPYPEYLEDGTKKMKARPWLTGPFEVNKEKVERDVVRVVERAISRVVR